MLSFNLSRGNLLTCCETFDTSLFSSRENFIIHYQKSSQIRKCKITQFANRFKPVEQA